MLTDKRALRTRMRAIRGGFVGPALCVPDVFRARLAPDLVVASYVPVGGEVDPAPLAAAARAAGCRIALPHVVDRATPIRFLAADTVLIAGPFGLRQPHGNGTDVVPDIVLTPLVAFDDAGNRLGQGAGHYDRAFAEHPHSWRVGVAWSVQQVDSLPADPWDVPLHLVITEKDVITP